MSRKMMRTLAGATLACVLGATPVLADWTSDIPNSACDPADREAFSKSLRDHIEQKVRRAEATIKAPTPVGDLSCLNDLMNAPLDIFSGMGSLLDSLSSGLSNLSAPSLNLDMDVSGMICGAAAKKWATLTSGLTDATSTLTSFANTAATSAERALSGGAMSIPGFSGGTSAADSSGQTGSIADYNPTATVNPTTEVSSETAAIPIYPDYSSTNYDTASMNQTYADYENQVYKDLGEYIGCMVSRNLNGSKFKGVNAFGNPTTTYTQTTNPNLADCTFDPGPAPVYVYGN